MPDAVTAGTPSVLVVDADAATAREALAAAAAFFPIWNRVPASERARHLRAAAELLEAHRAELVSLCVTEAGRGILDSLSEVREAVEGLVGARAGFGLHDAEKFDLRVLVERGGEGLAGEGFAPRRLDGVDRRAAALHHILHARPEHAIDRDQHFVRVRTKVRNVR